MPSIKRFFVRDGRLHPAWRAFLFLIAFAIASVLSQALVGTVYFLIRLALTGGPVEIPPEAFVEFSPLMALREGFRRG